MALNADARTAAIFNGLMAANPRIATDLSEDERDQMRAQLKATFGADATYLVANTVVNPLRGTAAAGASVQVAVPAGSGSVTSPASVTTNQGTIS